MANYSEDGSAPNDVSQLDSAGQAILTLLHKAAGAAEAMIEQMSKVRSAASAAAPACPVGSSRMRTSACVLALKDPPVDY